MKIIAFAGSNSKKSINKQLVNFVLRYFENEDIELLDLNDYEVSLYGIDKEKASGIPNKIKEFVNKFKDADLIITSLAEHNGTYSVAFKNIIDWSSRHELGFFNDKPMLLMATSPGGYGGGNVLEAAKKRLPKFKAEIQGVFSLPNFKDNFDSEKGIVNQDLLKKLEDVIDSVKVGTD